MTEAPETRLKRLRMRSWRRGIKEMDIILGTWSDERLATLDDGTLDIYEVLLEENDQDLYRWVTGQEDAPEHLRPLLAQIAEHANAI
ncbi:succinate dehydrogenase assembly factor 2 [Anianabacter salinae]|uniref:succinate dehydrogenase assembly factor 2 n=1 Tax=Anianabacter salinae TaxID=2851023 RepID=UPI00225E6BA6|nr:succinate dehydrogenase assembly factor 2 [Anianabacter salinae]MBV0912553.1 succinate dehydrogenase assembly factor 2 [Anianabacter salinae]